MLPNTGPLSLVVLLASAVTVALQQSALICRKHAIHLLVARHCMLKITLHLINVRFKTFQEGEHFFSGTIEAQNLAILLVYGLLCDIANEAEVLLDPMEKILGAETR